MSAFTSKATGNWSASGQTTWNEVGIPGPGDVATINALHTVTVDADTTSGDGSNSAIVIAALGTLEIAAGIVLTLDGAIANSGTLTLDSGASIVYLEQTFSQFTEVRKRRKFQDLDLYTDAFPTTAPFYQFDEVRKRRRQLTEFETFSADVFENPGAALQFSKFEEYVRGRRRQLAQDSFFTQFYPPTATSTTGAAARVQPTRLLRRASNPTRNRIRILK